METSRRIDSARSPFRGLPLRRAVNIEGSSDAIIRKTLSGIITSCHPGDERTSGYEATEAIGESTLKTFPPVSVEVEPENLHHTRELFNRTFDSLLESCWTTASDWRPKYLSEAEASRMRQLRQKLDGGADADIPCPASPIEMHHWKLGGFVQKNLLESRRQARRTSRFTIGFRRTQNQEAPYLLTSGRRIYA